MQSTELRLTISVKMIMYRSNSYMPRATYYVMQTIVFIIEIFKCNQNKLFNTELATCSRW